MRISHHRKMKNTAQSVQVNTYPILVSLISMAPAPYQCTFLLIAAGRGARVIRYPSEKYWYFFCLWLRTTRDGVDTAPDFYLLPYILPTTIPLINFLAITQFS